MKANHHHPQCSSASEDSVDSASASPGGAVGGANYKGERRCPSDQDPKTATSQRKHHQQRLHAPIVVQHDYHDHSDDVEADESTASASNSKGTNSSLQHQNHVSFPHKLYDMLGRADADGIAEIVSWQAHGRCFIVRNADEFARILPFYFNQKKIASFHRQLNLYGFRRLTRGADRGSYYHECFLRGRPFLISAMTRCKIKGTGVRPRSNPDQEPDFWRMPWCVDVAKGTGDNRSRCSSSINNSTGITIKSTKSTPTSSKTRLEEGGSISSMTDHPQPKFGSGLRISKVSTGDRPAAPVHSPRTVVEALPPKPLMLPVVSQDQPAVSAPDHTVSDTPPLDDRALTELDAFCLMPEWMPCQEILHVLVDPQAVQPLASDKSSSSAAIMRTESFDMKLLDGVDMDLNLSDLLKESGELDLTDQLEELVAY